MGHVLHFMIPMNAEAPEDASGSLMISAGASPIPCAARCIMILQTAQMPDAPGFSAETASELPPRAARTFPAHLVWKDAPDSLESHPDAI